MNRRVEGTGRRIKGVTVKVADIMRTNLQTANPDTSIHEAITTLADAHVLGLPIIDRDGRLVGVLSASDVLDRLAEAADADERERLFRHSVVRDLMTPNPVTIRPDADVKDAAQEMLYLEVHRLFVVDAEKLVGIVSQSDVVRAVATKGAEAF